jgi:hypothetical protein
MEQCHTAFVDQEAANLEIGQPDFITAVCSNGGVNAQTLCNPTSVAVNSVGNLYVAHTGNNRLLEYNTPFSNMVVASVGKNIASQVFGQPNFGSNACASSASASTLHGRKANGECLVHALRGCYGLGGKPYIADARNNRVLEFFQP